MANKYGNAVRRLIISSPTYGKNYANIGTLKRITDELETIRAKKKKSAADLKRRYY